MEGFYDELELSFTPTFNILPRASTRLAEALTYWNRIDRNRLICWIELRRLLALWQARYVCVIGRHI